MGMVPFRRAALSALVMACSTGFPLVSNGLDTAAGATGAVAAGSHGSATQKAQAVAAKPARTTQPPVSMETVSLSQAMARQYWGMDPCTGLVTVQWLGLQLGTNATSTWTNTYSQYLAPERNTACLVTLNSRLPWSWTRLCSIMIHEYGHLLGHPHSFQSQDVMYPYYVRPVESCRQGVPPGLPPVAATVGTAIDAGLSSATPDVMRA